jgi:signal transduction histidine kinase
VTSIVGTQDAVRAVHAACAAARSARRGLIIVLAGHDPAPAWRSPWRRRAAVTALMVLAVPLAVLAGLQGSPALLTLVTVVAPLLLAVRYPLLAWRVAWLALLIAPLAGVRQPGAWPWPGPQLITLVMLFCLAGLRHPRSALWWLWALSLIPWWRLVPGAGSTWSARAAGSVAFTAAAVAVDALASRRRAQQALAGQAELTELEQARRAVLEERARIARELHDVVAHHMSLIAVQAETAPFRLERLPEPVRAEFGSLSGAARDALTDMRRLLDVLRDDEAAERAPQPQLCDLPVLIGAARRAGVAVELIAVPEPGLVPAGVGICAYRIVQESLSNASRHAPGAAVTVSVEQGPGAVLLRVANGPGEITDTAAARHGAGHGLMGMRERVALLGGSLLAESSPDGGFVVSAVLPVGAAA